MLRSIISFKNSPRRMTGLANQQSQRSCFMLIILLISMCGLGSLPAFSQVFMKQEDALRLAFPQADKIERQTLFLTEAQTTEIQKLARAKIESKIVIYYRATQVGKISGCGFFETTIIRTKPASIMAVVNPDSTLRMVEILAFYEPQDYLPTPRWLALFRGHLLNDGLWPKRDIHNISGATLSVQSITLAVRRLLATYVVAVSKELKK